MRHPSHKANWQTSLVAASILHALVCRGEQTIYGLSVTAHASESTIRLLVRLMRAAGVVHVSRWISSLDRGGHPSMVVAFGPGKDARKPKPLTRAENWMRWATKKRKQFGAEAANRMINSRQNGGADRVVLDGKTVYVRGAWRAI